MEIITDQDERLLGWAERRLGVSWVASQCRWLAGVDTDIRFVVVYSNFSPRNCDLTIATDGSKTWATRRSLRAIFAPPFELWGLRRVTFIVKADNQPSIRMLETAGARREGIARKAFDGDVDGIAFGMLREECRYL
jgi:hypothetical protein